MSSLARRLELLNGTALKPSLYLDFVGNASLDSRITFTRASTAYRRNPSAGLLESVAIDVQRRDHDPVTLAPLGLLIEEARTNLMTYSEDLSAGTGGWTNDACSVAGTNTAPDGASTAQKITEDGTSAAHRVRKVTSTFTAGATLTVSCFIKASGRNYAAMQFGAANGFRAGIDLALGTVVAGGSFGTGSYTSAGVEAYLNGWYRLWMTGTVDPASTTDEGYVHLRTSSGFTGQSYAGDGSSGILAWGYVVEAGAFRTSYIQTAGATVTRAADVATMALGSWFNAAAGTILVEASVPVLGGSGFKAAAVLSDGTTNNYMGVLHDQAGTTFYEQVTSGGVSQANFGSFGAITAGVPQRLAFAYSANDFAGCRNGGAVSTDTSGSVPSVTTLGLGGFVSQQLCGHIRRLSYWPRRLPDNVLQSLTR